MMRWPTWILALAAILPLCHASPDEERLLTSLMDRYRRGGSGPLVLPRLRSTDTVNVTFGVALLDVDLDTKQQLLTSHVWLRETWNDPSLTWNPADFGGVANLKIPISLIWRPDIKLFNSHTFSMDIAKDSLAVVYSSGMVIWIPPAVAVTRSRRVQDGFSSKLKFGSWTYDSSNVNLSFYDGAQRLDVDNFDHGHWKIAANYARLHTKKYSCCEELYQDMTFTLELK